jgi:hypothetical protein
MMSEHVFYRKNAWFKKSLHFKDAKSEILAQKPLDK